MSADDVELDPMMPPANDLPRAGSWVLVTIQLADGGLVELYLEGAIAGAIAGYEADPGEVPTIAYTDRHGQRRKGRLTQLFGGRK